MHPSRPHDILSAVCVFSWRCRVSFRPYFFPHVSHTKETSQNFVSYWDEKIFYVHDLFLCGDLDGKCGQTFYHNSHWDTQILGRVYVHHLCENPETP